VQLNMPVVGMGGLVGQVVQANHSTATVRLITDGQSQIGVRYGPGANSLAVISGHGPGKPLSAGLVPTNTALPPGTTFITSGLPNADFPGDIPVATVTSTSNGTTASQESVNLQPLADLSHLRYVSVVIYGPSS
jgi:cell shape-determining protein MreC